MPPPTLLQKYLADQKKKSLRSSVDENHVLKRWGVDMSCTAGYFPSRLNLKLKSEKMERNWINQWTECVFYRTWGENTLWISEKQHEREVTGTGVRRARYIMRQKWNTGGGNWKWTAAMYKIKIKVYGWGQSKTPRWREKIKVREKRRLERMRGWYLISNIILSSYHHADARENVKVAVGMCNLSGDNEFRGPPGEVEGNRGAVPMLTQILGDITRV